MDPAARIGRADTVFENVGAELAPVEEHHEGALDGVSLQQLFADEPLAVEAQNPVAPPPGPPIANHVVRPNVPPDQTLANEAKGKLLPTKEGLTELIGRGPKGEFKLFGFFGPTIQRETHYKAVLNALGNYHQMLESSSGFDPGTLDDTLKAQLDDIASKCREYQSAKFAPFKKEMGELLEKVDAERAAITNAVAVMEGLGGVDHDLTMHEIIGLVQTHPGITGADVRALVEKDMIGLVRANPKLTLEDLAFVEQMGIDFAQVQQQASDHLDMFAKIHHAVQFLAPTAEYARQADAVGKPADLPGEIHELAQHLKQVVDGAKAQNVGPGDARAYFDARVPINDVTFKGGHVQGDLVPFGKGAVSEVFGGSYVKPDGRVIDAVFKPVKALDYSNAVTWHHNTDLGIDQKKPDYALRNVACCLVDQALGDPLMVDTGLVAVGGQLYIVMEKALGQSPAKEGDVFIDPGADMAQSMKGDPQLTQMYAALMGLPGLEEAEGGKWKVIAPPGTSEIKIGIDFSDGAVREQMTSLQWKDVLLRDCDHHSKNYKFHKGDDGQFVLKAFDNDMAFGSQPYDKDKVLYNLPKLPKVISASLAASFRELHEDTGQRLADLLADLGKLLGPGEIAAFQDRLAMIVDAIDELERNGGVIADTADWAPRADGSDPVGDQLGVIRDFDPNEREKSFRDKLAANDASYLARDTLEQQAAKVSGAYVEYDLVA